MPKALTSAALGRLVPVLLALAAGVELLREGGNAVDAAIAAAYTLAVTHPQGGSPARSRGCLPAGNAPGSALQALKILQGLLPVRLWSGSTGMDSR